MEAELRIARILDAIADRSPRHSALMFRGHRRAHAEWRGQKRRVMQAPPDPGLRHCGPGAQKATAVARDAHLCARKDLAPCKRWAFLDCQPDAPGSKLLQRDPVAPSRVPDAPVAPARPDKTEGEPA